MYNVSTVSSFDGCSKPYNHAQMKHLYASLNHHKQRKNKLFFEIQKPLLQNHKQVQYQLSHAVGQYMDDNKMRTISIQTQNIPIPKS